MEIIWKSLPEMGACGMMIVVITIFLRFMAAERKSRNALVENHLKSSREDHVGMTNALDKVKEALLEAVIILRRLNGKS